MTEYSYADFLSINEAAQEGRVDIMRQFLADNRGSLHSNNNDSMGWQPLQSAARSGRLEAVRFCLDSGSDVNYKQTNGGKTALILAVYAGHLDVVKLLCERGADVNHKDQLNFTALSMAVEQGHTEIANYLNSL